MNADIRGWVNEIKGAGLKLLFGLLIMAIIYQAADKKYDLSQAEKRYNRDKAELSRINAAQAVELRFKDSIIYKDRADADRDKERQIKRLEGRIDYQDSVNLIADKSK